MGDDYKKIKKVISVNIVYFDLGSGDDYVYHGTTKFMGIHQDDELELSTKSKKKFNKKYPIELYPEYYIIKVNKFDIVAKDTLDEWIYFLRNERVKKDFTARGLQEAKKELDFMKLDEAQRLAYDRYIDERRFKMSVER